MQGPERYGNFYWCVKTKLSKSGEIYVHADRVEFTASGGIIFWQDPSDLPEAARSAAGRSFKPWRSPPGNGRRSLPHLRADGSDLGVPGQVILFPAQFRQCEATQRDRLFRPDRFLRPRARCRGRGRGCSPSPAIGWTPHRTGGGRGVEGTWKGGPRRLIEQPPRPSDPPRRRARRSASIGCAREFEFHFAEKAARFARRIAPTLGRQFLPHEIGCKPLRVPSALVVHVLH
jgi:hypothetical protein